MCFIYFKYTLITNNFVSYKAFVRPQLDHGDIMYDESFHHKRELFRYNGFLALTGDIRDTSEEKFCQELGLQSL